MRLFYTKEKNVNRFVCYGISCICLLLLCADSFAQTEISGILKTEKAVWETSAKDLAAQFPDKELFQWVDSAKTGLRYSADAGLDKMTFSGLPVYEAIFSLKNDKISRIYLSLFNRGDASRLAKTDYNELLKKLNDALDRLTGRKPGKETLVLIGDKRIYAKMWNCKNYECELKWSDNGLAGINFMAEFITLNILPPAQGAESLKIDQGLTKKVLAGRVKINDAGDHSLEVPMVDQGNKGYCVAAVAERVLKYYGSKIDQHILAEVTNMPEGGGATLVDIEKAAANCASKINVKYSKLYYNDDMYNFVNFNKMITMYNMEAARAGSKAIAIDKYLVTTEGQTVYDLSGITSAMNPDLYKKVRLKDGINFKRFQRDVTGNINAGIPLLWAVKLGIIKEESLPQQLGMHMRLITGYNDKEKKIIYSDSWGAGHEYKKMGWEDAWTITTFTGLFAPRLEK